MKAVSAGFLAAEAEAVPRRRIQTLVRANPEALAWVEAFANTGRASDWAGADVHNGLPNHAVCLTHANTLIRLNISPADDHLYMNRVPATGQDDATLFGQLATWTQLTSLGTLDINTRVAVVADATRVRIFYQDQTTLTVHYADSTNDGVTWGAPVAVATLNLGGSHGFMGLAAPDTTHVVQVVYRAATAVSPADEAMDYLAVAVADITTGTLAMHPLYPDPVTAASGIYLGSQQTYVDAAVLDPATGKIVIVLMDTLAGRPAATIYRATTFTDYFSVEQIDYAMPERDDVTGYRLGVIGNKVILHAERNMADSDFTTTRQAVLYYTTDGLHWSDAYLVGDGTVFNHGTPMLWQGWFYLVGIDSLWRCQPTSLFGGTAQEVDVTGSIITQGIDAPENPDDPIQASVSLRNTYRQWLDHPIVRDGAEIEIRAGYAGTLTNVLANPSFETDTVGWTVVNGAFSRDVTVIAPPGGVSSVQLLPNATGAAPGGFVAMNSAYQTLDPAYAYTMSAYLQNGTYPDTAWVEFFVTWSGGAHASVSSQWTTVATAQALDGAWLRCAATFVADYPDRTQAFFNLRVWGATATSQILWIDCVQVEQRTAATPYNDATTAYADTELLPLFIGAITTPQPSFSATDTNVALAATDYLGNLQQGVLDRTLYLPSPDRNAFLFTKAADLRVMAIQNGAWQWASVGGAGVAEATRKGDNTLFKGTGLAGRLDFSARLQNYNPSGSGMLCVVSMIWGASTDFTSYYELKWGAGVSGLDSAGSATGLSFLIHRNGAVRDATPDLIHHGTFPVPITNLAGNTWFRIRVTQDGSSVRIMVINELTGTGSLVGLFTHHDPLVNNGIVAVRANLPADAPTGGAAFATVYVDDVRITSSDYETLIEEYLTAIALQRGFETVVAEQIVDEHFTAAPSGWATFGLGSAWAYGSGGATFHHNGRAVGTLDALRYTGYTAHDVALEMDLAWDSDLTSFGALLRANATGTQYATLVVTPVTGYGYDDNGDTRNGWVVDLYTRLSSGVTKRQTYDVFLPAPPNNQIATFRFICEGPWYAVYANKLHLATFYDASITTGGFFGLAILPPDTQQSGTITISRFRIPRLGLGTLPILNPGDKLDGGLQDLLKALGAWIVADGRTLRVGVTRLDAANSTVDDDTWLSAGYNQDYTDIPTHVRVTSTDPSGNQIVGTVYSPSLWKARGRARYQVTQVQGLADADACRAQAWQQLLELERQARTRSYTMHPIMRIERFDLLDVTNTMDDTARLLYVAGYQIGWTRNEQTGEVTATMTARLEEKNGDTLDECTFFAPV